MLKLAVFGDPVAHSLSPRIHSAFARQLGLAVDYRAIAVPAGQLPAALASFRADGGSGANLTVPHKQDAVALCDRLDRAARQAGAVNTLVAEEEGWHGCNTDGAGLLLDLDRLGLSIEAARILIVGAGGATAGILGPLLDRRPAAIHLANRHRERAQALAARFHGVSAGGFEDLPPDRSFDLLIQATSLGHQGKVPAIEPRWLQVGAAAYDLNYGQAHRPFAAWCKRQDLPVFSGFGMLLGQAALAFERWTGQRPDPWALARLESLN